MDYYTYAYLRKDGTPYYVGKGIGRRAFTSHCHSVKIPPRDRILFLKQNLTEEQAFIHEIYMISVLGRKDLGTGILRNLTDGGEGFSSEQMKRYWDKWREKRLQEWRDEYDEQAQARQENYTFFNTLIDQVVSNRTFCSD